MFVGHVALSVSLLDCADPFLSGCLDSSPPMDVLDILWLKFAAWVAHELYNYSGLAPLCLTGVARRPHPLSSCARGGVEHIPLAGGKRHMSHV